ncbi:hypothetical protein SJA_C1-09770 [Sphingobium indicum UT26S]|uniref:Uncharacterized protein n=1 Tax=Sphingobium indicum (strain DSM 16413 / CCM 7287 / MTCC 6362 / UT26 / NBRC 101211 / UT26S) TaxID=452662 RepID=D4YZM9_SPHIU|nr:hypothetical protein SJA_C1-09770 [Sphingobium indicum UT26S]
MRRAERRPSPHGRHGATRSLEERPAGTMRRGPPARIRPFAPPASAACQRNGRRSGDRAAPSPSGHGHASCGPSPRPKFSEQIGVDAFPMLDLPVPAFPRLP